MAVPPDDAARDVTLNRSASISRSANSSAYTHLAELLTTEGRCMVGFPQWITTW